MNEEELDSIEELIERKIYLAEVSGGLTSSDKKFINLWNYAIKLNQLNNELQENYKGILKQRDDISKNASETIEKYQQENQKLKDRINKAISCIENFLCTEEYIKVDGVAIADNYRDTLEILKGGNNE